MTECKSCGKIINDMLTECDACFNQRIRPSKVYTLEQQVKELTQALADMTAERDRLIRIVHEYNNEPKGICPAGKERIFCNHDEDCKQCWLDWLNGKAGE